MTGQPESIEDAAARVVADWQPLTPEQIARLRALFGTDRPAPAPDAESAA